MYYPDELIEEVRSRSDIVTVVGTRVRLTKKGANYFGCCPFHNEKTPSFSVSPGKQMYYCFGCGAGGNVVTFLMNYENYSFSEALGQLASAAGITLPKRELTAGEKQEESLRSRLLEMNGEAAKYFYYALRQGPGAEGLAYLSRRGLNEKTLRDFGLGYALNQWDDLYQYLKSKGFSDQELKTSALVKFREEKGPMDFFRNRVMFPIMDKNSRVIGFGGRVMDGSEPKYLNSLETPVFDKGRNLYGLNRARLTRRPYYLLMEGYMDVIALHQAGIDCAVASLGTAFTSGQAMLLKRYTKQVILTYDSDGAGIKAAMRAIPILRDVGVDIKVLNMRPYKDPDEFITHLGVEAFEERIKQAENFFLYQSDVWKSGFDLNDPSQQTAFQRKLAEELTSFADELERENYLEAVCRRHLIDKDKLRSLVNRLGNQRFDRQSASAEPEEGGEQQPLMSSLHKDKDEGLLSAQQVLLNWAVQTESSAVTLKRLLKPEDFLIGLYREIYERILSAKETGETLVAGAILNRYLEDEEKSKLAAAIFSKGLTEELSRDAKARVLTENLKRLRKEGLNRALKDGTRQNEFQQLIGELRQADRLHIDAADV